MAKKCRFRNLHSKDGRQWLQEVGMLMNAANTLILEQCSAKAVTRALHPIRWLRSHVKPGTCDLFKDVLLAEESPRLLAAAKHLVAIAKRYCPKIRRLKLWSYEKMVQQRGTDFADSEVRRRGAVFDPKIAAAKRHLAKRGRGHASEAESMATGVFVDALTDMRNSYHPNHGPTLPQPGTFRSVEVPVSRDYPHTSGRN